ncbi:hypothetical protein DVR12_10475 [Chitinophaga silvatica]|uniref:Aspartyl protease n=1 Tax=Chitinophaga silvatica TaxID=2282649 RepID=A0A3E1YBR5_9BACT|nr:aspartyl protease family protein [Chitinophaga silvatica]RFS23431.1 hypothetical protein DVR12_10475 [Chitinophaga silvatica]
MWRFLWIAILFFYVNVPVQAQRNNGSDIEKPIAIIPFQLIDKQVVIPVLASGSTDTLHFIFDTGAEVTVLNFATANKLKLKGSGEVFMSGINNLMVKTSSVSINALYIREVRMPYVKAYLENLSNLGAIDGIIGIALLKPYIVKIDYRKQELVLYKSGKTPIGNTGRLLHFQLNYTTPVIDASIQLSDGRRLPGHYHITTGGDYGVLFNWPYVDKNKLNTILPTINTDPVRDVVKTLYYINSTIPSLELGGHSIKQVPVSYCKDIDDLGVFTEIAGSIGYDIWKQFTLTINYDKQELYLE